MYHSITFGTKNTWDDWHLIPSSRPLFNPPALKTNYVEIPGGDGILDLTTVLAGRPLYKNRTGSIEFYVENGFMDWTAMYSEIMNYLHGQRMRAILEDDPGYYYEGRFNVNAWKSDKDRSIITIDYDVGPYKRDINGSTEEWLWDPFNFETGIIRYYKDIPINGEFTVMVVGDVMSICPTIICSAAGMSVTFEDRTYQLAKGSQTIYEIALKNGENYLTFHGNGNVTIEMEGGRL